METSTKYTPTDEEIRESIERDVRDAVYMAKFRESVKEANGHLETRRAQKGP